MNTTHQECRADLLHEALGNSLVSSGNGELCKTPSGTSMEEVTAAEMLLSLHDSLDTSSPVAQQQEVRMNRNRQRRVCGTNLGTRADVALEPDLLAAPNVNKNATQCTSLSREASVKRLPPEEDLYMSELAWPPSCKRIRPSQIDTRPA